MHHAVIVDRQHFACQILGAAVLLIAVQVDDLIPPYGVSPKGVVNDYVDWHVFTYTVSPYADAGQPVPVEMDSQSVLVFVSDESGIAC